jgi:hypothetical protein
MNAARCGLLFAMDIYKPLEEVSLNIPVRRLKCKEMVEENLVNKTDLIQKS